MTHPHLGGAFALPGDELLLLGEDLGSEDSGRSVYLRGEGGAASLALSATFWGSSEIRVQVPSQLAELNAPRAEGARAGGRRSRVGFHVRVGLQVGGHWVGRTRRLFVVTGGSDLDGDGVLAPPFGEDCDDLDDRRRPGLPERADREQLDEDCDPNTRIEPAADPLAGLAVDDLAL